MSIAVNETEERSIHPARAEPSPGWRYSVPKERGLGWFVAVSSALFTAAMLLSALLPPAEKLPPMIEVELGIDGVENEPPPLGEPDAGAGEIQPTPAPPEPEPQPLPEVQPVPEPEPPPEPEMAEPPVPEPPAQFEVPEEKPVATPKPKPVAIEKPKPKPAPSTAAAQPRAAATPAAGAAGSGLTTGRAGVRGSPGGQPGGRGGGRGDFVSTPQPQYDATARQRNYQGRGVFIIRYENGRIISVETQTSTGVPYLDARTTAWIKSRWRVKSGVSGAASLPITWQLR